MEFSKNIQYKLSKREIAVVKLMVLGYTNSDIASKLYLSSSLVKTILSNVFVKLNAKNRANACYILGLDTAK